MGALALTHERPRGLPKAKGGLITAKYDIDGVGEGLSKDEVIEAARREVATRSRGLKDLLEQFKTDMEKIISAQAQG